MRDLCSICLENLAFSENCEDRRVRRLQAEALHAPSMRPEGSNLRASYALHALSSHLRSLTLQVAHASSMRYVLYRAPPRIALCMRPCRLLLLRLLIVRASGC